MRSSISSSEVSSKSSLARVWSLRAEGLERPVPVAPWLRILLLVAATTFVLLLAWETEMRNLGLRAGDIGDAPGYWAAERRKIDAGPRDPIVLIGDSRILFDTDLAVWQRLTGRRPIQLGLMGANAEPVLHDLATDEHFAGLVVIGTAEFSYFNEEEVSLPVLDYIKTESPSQRSGQEIYKTLSRYFAFLDSNYTLFTLLERRRWPERNGVEGAYKDVWKVIESYDDRQSYLWDRIERDDFLRKHAQLVWLDVFAGPTVTADKVERVIANTKADIDRIRARGGEAVWIRPPSSGPLLDIERSRYPRQKVWDRLVRDTASFGVYFDDYLTMRYLSCPDWSHLSKTSAIAFTDAYLRVLRQRFEWLSIHESFDRRLQSSHK